MGFQILNAEGNAIPLNDLDIEAATFWGTEVDDKKYAKPAGSTSWFDTIGWAIDSPKESYNKEWGAVRASLSIIQTSDIAYTHKSIEDRVKEYQQALEYLQPYYDLIDHWQEKGYKPHKV